MKRYMMFTLLLIMLFAVIPSSDVAVTDRGWVYGNLTILISPKMGWLVIPGLRYEFTRFEENISADTKDLYFSEFFTGPIFFTNIGKIRVVMPFFYYYMGFPMKALDKYAYCHNLEFAPSFILKKNDLTLSTRFIFHNKIYSSFYKEIMNRPEWQSGYSMLLRWRLMFQYAINEKITLELANEPFYGVVEDKDKPAVNGPGFYESGFIMNRIYAGFNYSFDKNRAINLNYVYETSYSRNNEGKKELDQIGHYLFLTIKYTLKLF